MLGVVEVLAAKVKIIEEDGVINGGKDAMTTSGVRDGILTTLAMEWVFPFYVQRKKWIKSHLTKQKKCKIVLPWQGNLILV